MSDKINKKALERFISRYHLSGLIASVSLHSEKGTVSVRAACDTQNLVADIKSKEVVLPDGDYHIYDTSHLLAMLNVLGDECTVEVKFGRSGMPLSLVFDDGDADATIVLSESSAIPKSPGIKTTPTVDLSFTINADFAKQFGKAHSALPDAATFAILTDGSDTGYLVINYDDKKNTSRVKLPLNTTGVSTTFTLYFNTDHMAAVLKALALGPNDGAQVFVSNVMNGFARITSDTLQSTYYLIGEKPAK
jgi:hypothetical protein